MFGDGRNGLKDLRTAIDWSAHRFNADLFDVALVDAEWTRKFILGRRGAGAHARLALPQSPRNGSDQL